MFCVRCDVDLTVLPAAHAWAAAQILENGKTLRELPVVSSHDNILTEGKFLITKHKHSFIFAML
jgi:hypothetical protein